LKFRVQSYSELESWKPKALPHLRQNEGWNNLFWQIIQNREKERYDGWAANVFVSGETALSAIQTPSNFLLLSHGELLAVDALAKYAISHEWKLDGVSGERNLVKQFLLGANLVSMDLDTLSGREFKLFQSGTEEQTFECLDYELEQVSSLDWPRVRIWAQQFALEADPPMNLSAITQLAKKLYSSKQLYVLKDMENHPCAMAGFGRSTNCYQVINMVYVPNELRRQGIAEQLINLMVQQSQRAGYEGCLLFSDWKGEPNLYDSMGFKQLGHFVEYDLA